MNHEFIKHVNCRVTHCCVCDGGLKLCGVCHLAEGTLTTDCPGSDATAKSHLIYNGVVDYRGGEWVYDVSPHAPPEGLT